MPLRRLTSAIFMLWAITGCVNVPDYTFAPFEEEDADRRPPPPQPDGGVADVAPVDDDAARPPDMGCVRSDEVCNGRDDDCDRVVDEDFDLDTNLDNCGGCGLACRPTNADGICEAGMCALDACLDGFADVDGETDNGCEYTCPGPIGPEMCNGLDDDCDGAADEDVDLSVPDQFGVCADAIRPCLGADGYGEPDFSLLPGYQADENLCDAADNDCDGAVDEGQPELGAPCSAGLGACARDGVQVCGPDRRSAECDAVPGEPAPADATCDGVDDDCDDRIDEDAPGCTLCNGSDRAPCNDCPVGTPIPSGWVCVPGGQFTIGSAPDEVGRLDREGPAHPVRITRPYLIQATELTQREWGAVFPDDPSFFGDAPRQPVERVTWFEAAAFANALSEAEGRQACYVLEGCNGADPGRGLVCPVVRFEGVECTGYRLPTEAEWALAARGGTMTRYWFGDREDGLAMTDWYAANGDQRTHDVGQLAPNPMGLYDVHGNVWEWVHDGFGLYDDVLDIDPAGIEDAELRTRRGGAFGGLPDECRSAFRAGEPPTTRSPSGGFRLVRTIP